MIHNLIFLPLYNGLVGIMDLIPGIDVGLAVIVFTVIVRLALFPLAKAALLTQVKMKEIEPEMAKIRSQYVNDKQTQTVKIMALYKERGVHPFYSFLLLLIQLPILLGLISVFYHIIPTIDPANLYSFISVPVAKPTLLGLDLAEKSLILALITAVIQYLQMHYSVAARQSRAMKNSGIAMDKTAQMSNAMADQMKYFLPIIAFASLYWIIPSTYPKAAAVIAIYWSVSSLFTLGQELYIRKKHLNGRV